MSEPICAICGRDNRDATHTALEAYGHLAHPFAPPAVIDAAHLERQRAWSHETFGPGARTEGLLAHIRKELDEIEERPDAVEEWVDVVILAIDGAWRAGHESDHPNTYRRRVAERLAARFEQSYKPDEPTGLGAIVEDSNGERWVRATNFTTVRHWRGCDQPGQGRRRYDEIDVVKVLSDGVQS